MRRVGCRKNLLDFFAAGKMCENAGAFDCSAAFEVEAGFPRFVRGIFGWRVAGAKIKGRNLVRGIR